MAFRAVVAAVCLAHQQLDDTALMVILLALTKLAGEAGCSYHLERQIRRACREDAHPVARLLRLRWRRGGVATRSRRAGG